MNELVLPYAGSVDASNFPAHGRLALRLLENLQHGRLDVRFPDGQRASFGEARDGHAADLQLNSWNAIRSTLASGDIGFAESYIAGDWATDDLARLLTFFLRNRETADRLIYGTFAGRLVHRLRHLLNRNTRAQAKRNIHAHYDLGNDFYALWLDPTMSYSSALLPTHSAPHTPLSDSALVEGQAAKYRRVLDEMQLGAAARILEIGCGWGGFAETALRAGHAVTGLTLSTEQLEYARERLAPLGAGWDLRLQDYREEHGQYDGIASIEMFEAVGEAYWPSYFATLKRCLAPRGRACVQTIVIADELFDRYRVGTDFIQQYIFPGGMLPSPSAFERAAARAGLVVVGQHAFGYDYARTLATWRQRFHARRDAVRALGFDGRFVRIWDFYLAYCEAAFARRSTDVVQYTLAHA
ncbi:MAG TPA: cyclopropane-fatty-acyl-phospholipid synthase family protein [Burkholderiaceae bacterium]|nr:cyclopropane-fatty-acyl-phospholipid synthase family protein [Burkholderiaceae bacterium]